MRVLKLAFVLMLVFQFGSPEFGWMLFAAGLQLLLGAAGLTSTRRRVVPAGHVKLHELLHVLPKAPPAQPPVQLPGLTSTQLVMLQVDCKVQALHVRAPEHPATPVEQAICWPLKLHPPEKSMAPEHVPQLPPVKQVRVPRTQFPGQPVVSVRPTG